MALDAIAAMPCYSLTQLSSCSALHGVIEHGQTKSSGLELLYADAKCSSDSARSLACEGAVQLNAQASIIVMCARHGWRRHHVAVFLFIQEDLAD